MQLGGQLGLAVFRVPDDRRRPADWVGATGDLDAIRSAVRSRGSPNTSRWRRYAVRPDLGWLRRVIENDRRTLAAVGPTTRP